MPILTPRDEAAVRKEFERIAGPVKLVVFSQGLAAPWGIRFYGIPLGYEFSNLIDSIIVASTGQPALSEDTLASLRALDSDVDIKVFSTPT
jgi:alkyl hydroperoxide reductase subunit AhpF